MTEAKEFPISAGYLWWDSLPSAWIYKAETIKQIVLPVDNAREIRSNAIGLKLFFPKIHMMSGILGLEFAKVKSETLSIEIYVNNSKKDAVSVHAGLPDELAEIVLKEISDTISELSSFSSGIIRVNHAAWDEIDSPPFMFRLLSRSLIGLLLCETVSKDIVDNVIRMAMQKLRAKQK